MLAKGLGLEWSMATIFLGWFSNYNIIVVLGNYILFMLMLRVILEMDFPPGAILSHMAKFDNNPRIVFPKNIRNIIFNIS